MTFKEYVLLEKRKKKKKKSKRLQKDKYPLFWHGYPLGGYIQYSGDQGTGEGGGEL